jgi:protein-tyrosine phosphatase
MDWITDEIAIGNYLEAQDVSLLKNERIQSVLSLDRTLEGKSAAEMALQQIEVVPLEDAPGNDPRLFRRAIDSLTRLIEEAAPVLVQCHAGRSRSAIVVAGFLMHAHGLEAHEALNRVAAKREIAITAGLERLLETIG